MDEFARFSEENETETLRLEGPRTPGNKYLYAKLANKHCLNDRGSRMLGFRLEQASLAALMSSRRTEESTRAQLGSATRGNEKERGAQRAAGMGKKRVERGELGPIC